MTRRVLVAIGTRPEIIKMAPVVWALRRRPDTFDVRVLFTGQHRDLLRQHAAFFELAPDVDLDVMTQGQTLPELTARLVRGVDDVLQSEAPDVVLAQGDTTTVFAVALGCFYRRIAFGHVEAGLRTPTLYNPYPEEANRRLATVLTRFHFAPTAWSADNLKREAIPTDSVYVTGNTVIDTLLWLLDRESQPPRVIADLEGSARPIALVTLHRRESFGAPLREALGALRTLLVARPELVAVYPVHPNPNVSGPAREVLGDLPNARLVEPLEYGDFIGVMRRATVCLSDSGGVQEEAPTFGVPVLVMRDTTERPEGVEAGVTRLVGTQADRIVGEALRLVDDPEARAAMRTAVNPYGDGRASERIADVLATAPLELQ